MLLGTGGDQIMGSGIYEKPAFWYNPYTYMERYENYTLRDNMLFSVSPNYKINKNLSIRGTFSRRDDATRYRYFMPYSLTKSASGTEGGYMDFLNGFGFSDSNRVEDNYEIRVNYQNKFGKFDLNAFVGGIITNFNWYGNSAQMDVFGKLGKLIIPDVWDFKMQILLQL
jgi:hypothetical protein